MKNLLLLLLGLLALPTLAQKTTGPPGGGTTSPVIVSPSGFGDPPPASYSCTEAVSRQQRTADSLLLPLDKSQVPTHILYDRVAPVALLDIFNRRYDNPDTSDVHHFLQAYYELHQADYTRRTV